MYYPLPKDAPVTPSPEYFGQRAARVLLGLTLLLHVIAVVAGPGEILLIHSGDNAIYSEVGDAARKRLAQLCDTVPPSCQDHRIRIIESDLLAQTGPRPAPDLAVTLGRRAAETWAATEPATPTLYALIPHTVFELLPPVATANPGASALFLDQPAERQLRVIHAALPQIERVGVLTHDHLRAEIDQLTRSAARLELTLVQQPVADIQSLGAALETLLQRVDVLFALPDPGIYNPTTARTILLTSYRNRIPVIGFSLGYVKAGALLAVHSTPAQIGRQIGEILAGLLVDDSATLPPPAFPRYFSVSVNTSVARSLGLELPSEVELEARAEVDR